MGYGVMYFIKVIRVEDKGPLPLIFEVLSFPYYGTSQLYRETVRELGVRWSF